MFYNGDFNGTGIDFKTDGTYIFDNSAIGISDYFYGTYTIIGNRITMDKDTIDYFSNIKYLEIKEETFLYKDSTRNELYLFNVDRGGNIIERATEYRVVVDNRK